MNGLMRMHKGLFLSIVAALFFLSGCYPVVSDQGSKNYDHIAKFPSSRYPETAEHMRIAIQKGESSICTIDRDGANENRKESLEGIPTRRGYDRDEWPLAMCEEGGEGANIVYVHSSDNRGAGSWVGNALKDYPDGTKVKFVVPESGQVTSTMQITSPNDRRDEDKDCSDFTNQKEAKKYLLPGDPHRLDPDRDGKPCESLPLR